jgi:hypothetical protein
MSYTFQRFTEVGKRFEDRITVTRGRSIGLPTRFYADNSISKYKYAILLYDKDKNAIGIHFTNNEDEPGRIAITKSKENYGAHILGTSFFRANRINSKKYAGRYEYKKLTPEESGLSDLDALFVFELKEKEEGKE